MHEAWVAVGAGLMLAGCATLPEMRRETPDVRTAAGIAPEQQETVARCIQDRA